MYAWVDSARHKYFTHYSGFITAVEEALLKITIFHHES